jgi:hypothetical protein
VRTRLPVAIYRRSSDEFSPTDITGLALWLDASQESTITLNGSNVSEWRDVRPEVTYKVTNVAAEQQPSRVTSSKNGLSGINFQAGRSLSVPTDQTFNFPQPTTYFIVFQAPTGSGSWGLFDGATTRQHVFGNSQTSLTMFAGSSAAAATIDESAFYAAILIYNGSASSRRLNSKTATTVNSGANNINRLVIGSAGGVRGDVNEFGMFSRAVSDSEAIALLTYLGKKWAITIA